MEKTTEARLFTKDKAAMTLTIVSGALVLLNVASVFVRLRSHDFKVPVQYVVNDGSVLQTSNWLSLYSLILVSILGFAAAIYLAHQLYKASRQFAVAALAVYVVIAVFSLLVTNALLGLVGKV